MPRLEVVVPGPAKTRGEWVVLELPVRYEISTDQKLPKVVDHIFAADNKAPDEQVSRSHVRRIQGQ